MRIVRDPKIDRLGRLALFADCTLPELARIAAAAEDVTVPRFRDLTHEGDTHDDLVYVILDGMVQVKQGARVLAYLQDGDVVGELSALDGTPRSATVTTVVDTQLLAIDRRHLGPLLDANPRVAARLDRVADQRRAA